MPLNYSKWDQLELSDDSDIETHPNVDKRSMINWKQRDIHEKREARKVKILKLKQEIELNDTLLPRLKEISSTLTSSGLNGFREVVRKLKEEPSDAKPATGAQNQPTYDMMMLSLVLSVWKEAGESLGLANDPKSDPAGITANNSGIDQTEAEAWAKALSARMEKHTEELVKRTEQAKKEIDDEEREQKKKITSDDVKEGWSTSKVAPAKPSPLEDEPKKTKEKKKETTIEVLNPKASSSAAPAAVDDDVDSDDEVPTLTASAQKFAQLPLRGYDKSWEFIQRDGSVLTASTSDALLAEAFDLERKGDTTGARKAVHQSLLIQYCRKLGPDGVRLFFQRMIDHNPKAEPMFQADVDETYGRVSVRVKEMKAEAAARGETMEGEGEEQIQLVAEDPNVKIGFNVPDGPPPDDLRLEGEGTEDLDIDSVKAFLQRKWEIFQEFKPELRDAMKAESLEAVNRVLARMKVDEAEAVVGLMQEGGMLSFSESGVRDMTGK